MENANTRSILTASFVFAQLLGVVLACSSSGNLNNRPTATKPDPKAPLTEEQKTDLYAVMKLTDKCDSVAKNRSKIRNAWGVYIAEYTKADDKYREVRPKLSKNDARMILDGMMTAYESIGQILLARYERKTKESPDDWIILAGIRKELLKRIVENNLTPEMERLLETARENDK